MDDVVTCAWAPRTRLDGAVLGACARVDRFVLDHFIRRRPTRPGADLRDRLARAREFYSQPEFLARPETFFATPSPLRVSNDWIAPLPGGDLRLLRYESDFEPVFPEARGEPIEDFNRSGVALWWRHAASGHPAILCVHGYGGGQLWMESLAFEAFRFFRAGVDVLVYVLPHHGSRTPPGAPHSGATFFDMDLVRTNEAFARAIYELRGLLHHLRRARTGRVGAFGMSLGAYTVALLASVEPRLAFVAAMIPIVSFADRWWAEGARDPWFTTAMEHGWTLDRVRSFFGVHEPLARASLVPHERRLVIGARGDAICTPEHADALWRHWERPRIHWYSGGHLVQLGRGAALAEVRRLALDVRPSARRRHVARGGRREAVRRAARRPIRRPVAASPSRTSPP